MTNTNTTAMNTAATTTTTQQQQQHPYPYTKADTGTTSTGSSNDDETLRKLLKPAPSRDDVMNILLQYYYNHHDDDDIDIDIEKEKDDTTTTTTTPTTNVQIICQLDSYDDCNYQIRIRNDIYLLKITNGVESNDYIQHNTIQNINNYNAFSPSSVSVSSVSVIQLQHTIMETLHKNGICTTLPVKPLRYPTSTSRTTAMSSSNPLTTNDDTSHVLLLYLPVVSSKSQSQSSSSSSSQPPPPPPPPPPPHLHLLAVRLYTWVHGSPMSTIPDHQLSLPIIIHIGQQLGRINHILDQLSTSTVTNTVTSTTTTTIPCTDSISSRTNGTTNDTNNDSSSISPQQQLLQHQTQPEVIQQPQHRYHQWDTKNTLDLLHYTKYICGNNNNNNNNKDEKRRTMIRSIIETFRTDLQMETTGSTSKIIPNDHCNTTTTTINQRQQLSSLFRTGMIMGDYNDANIILDPNTLQFAGVIDFGDSLESWRVLDITIAMAYAMLTTYGQHNHSSISAMAAMLRGYNSIYPLTDNEREHLVLLVACRLACSVTLGAFSISQNPQNKEYLSLHSEPAWNALELIWGYDVEYRQQMKSTLNRMFDQACSYISSPPTDTTTTEISSYFDLSFPDPSVVDPFASIRIK